METNTEPKRLFQTYEEYRQRCLNETVSERIKRDVSPQNSPNEIGAIMAKAAIVNIKRDSNEPSGK